MTYNNDKEWRDTFVEVLEGVVNLDTGEVLGGVVLLLLNVGFHLL